MTSEFKFRTAESIKDFNLFRKSLIKNPLDYQGYFQWADKAMDEIFLGYKKVQLAFYDDFLIGYLLSQPSKTARGFREMKSARVLGDYQRRLVLSFMIRQEEVEAKNSGDLAMICDVRSNKLDVIKLLNYNGYLEVARADVYNEGYEDIVFVKPLDKT